MVVFHSYEGNLMKIMKPTGVLQPLLKWTLADVFSSAGLTIRVPVEKMQPQN